MYFTGLLGIDQMLANLENLLELYLVIDYWYFQLNNLLFLVPINAHTL